MFLPKHPPGGLLPRTSNPITSHLLPRDSHDQPHIGSEFGLHPSTPPTARLDTIGISYLIFAGIWTLALGLAMTYLYTKRHTPTLRIRGLPLTFAGIVLLHLYWATVQSGYTIGPLAPALAEYWIMGIWYPFGIALFQAGNSQFLHIARAQARFARGDSGMGQLGEKKKKGGDGKKGGLWARVRVMEYSQRMFLFVTLGMAVQLVVVVVVFMISKKFHPSFGIDGTEVYGKTEMEIAIQQGRGWEWWPSLFWQFLWAWVVAPIILWRSRGIKDTHGWQLQTVACCIAGLPAAPMWLVALYVPAMGPVNAVFIPPQWIAVSIFVIEIFTVFLPCWQVHKHQALRQETLDCIASWESKKKLSSVGTSAASTAATTNTYASSHIDPLSPTSTLKPESTPSSPDTDLPPTNNILTMAALEHVLLKNPEPLRHFSATRDFSGENIAFLTAVSTWKSALPAPFLRNRHNTSPDIVRREFSAALRIYVEFISPKDAEFPINIAWADLRKLQGVFERAARSIMDGPDGREKKRRDSALLFGEVDFGNESEVGIASQKAEEGKAGSAETLVLEEVGVGMGGKDGEEELWTGDIPAAFDAGVFDAAQASIKYLVLTNTWPKYVRERRSSEGSVRTGGTDETAASKSSLRRALAFLGPWVRRASAP
ncbi:hypothetical protein QBC34DRAFT_474202 [Podospora aff. communis PSN243]|uniref:RGS domain-containing protein n=1 Tax=Podospora aff. communis PSN243 TaxID=3040156 RepID=A0AAV9G9E6_9PEZI|nr:hypothetical protein QBC34DRAFT_474202 [Podospora aff. communis PSN243]